MLAFTGSWSEGGLVLDGPGASLWVRLSLHHWRAGGVPFWMPEMWAGTPAWALVPTLPVFSLVPLAAVVGPVSAVKLATVGAQVVGSWGAFVLARSLWQRTVPALAAGVAYGLQPLLISEGALAGHQPSVWVMALTPWLVWSLLRALRGDGRHLALSGLLIGVAIVEQPENLYGLALLSACVTILELARGRGGTVPARAVLVRAVFVAVIGLGLAAHWALPFLSLDSSFVLTPPTLVRSALLSGVGAAAGHEPGLFLTRAATLDGNVTFGNVDFLTDGGFYLGAVCLGLTLTAVVLLARRDDDRGGGELSAILFASALGLWTSTGGVPLASSALVRERRVIPLVVIGAVAALLSHGFLRHLKLGKGALIGAAVTAALLVGLPYLAPFLALQEVVPGLNTARFPRLYPIAALGLALGTAYPLARAARWAEHRRPRLAPLLTITLTLAVVAVFLVDAHPYRSFYRVSSPEDERAHRELAAELADLGGQFRVAASLDPRSMDAMADTGYRVTGGWPHPIASTQIWRLTGESELSVAPGYRFAALGLASASVITREAIEVGADGRQSVSRLVLQSNPLALPMVRAYDKAVVVESQEVSAELATSLAQRHITLVTGDRATSRDLGIDVRGSVEGHQVCADRGGGVTRGPEAGPLSGELATACSTYRWNGVLNDVGLVNIGPGAGALFRSPREGLRGISVALDRGPGPTELSLHEVAADGRSVGRELQRVRASGTDDKGLPVFRFDPQIDSAGKTYLFVLSCPTCKKGEEPQLTHVAAERGPANLVVGGRLSPRSAAAFSLVFDHLAAAPAPLADIDARQTRPGQWRIRISSPRPTLVVVAESYFPGWRGRLDGRNVRVYQADGAFLGVPVEAGQHELTLDYVRPAAVPIGAGISLLTLGLTVLLFVAGCLRRSRRTTAARQTVRAVGSPGHPYARDGERNGQGGLGDEATTGRAETKPPPRTAPPVTSRRPSGRRGRVADRRRGDGDGTEPTP
ncbi:MAG TPA: hypothetical protein VG455_02695 [Acidimicrobiales bacterium]|nr:hypothetical protein [Acidimicrobiales bacterium]